MTVMSVPGQGITKEVVFCHRPRAAGSSRGMSPVLLLRSATRLLCATLFIGSHARDTSLLSRPPRRTELRLHYIRLAHTKPHLGPPPSDTSKSSGAVADTSQRCGPQPTDITPSLTHRRMASPSLASYQGMQDPSITNPHVPPCHAHGSVQPSVQPRTSLHKGQAINAPRPSTRSGLDYLLLAFPALTCA